MGFLSKLFGGMGSKFERIGNLDNTCPYCGSSLAERPKRKKRCPHCRNYIYVRTRPADRKKVLVTEEQAQEIEQQWEVYHCERYADPEERKEFERAKKALAAQLGKEPSRQDVFWSVYNKRLLEHARNGDWGLYRNTRFDMAELLSKEGKRRQALETYLEISYFDANGPTNVGGINAPAFSPDLAIQAPAIVHSISSLTKELGLGRTDLKEAFHNIATRLQRDMKLPIAPDRVWKELSNELSEIEKK